MAQTYVKSATEVASFSIDWSDALGAATIAVSAWAVEAGITKDSDSKTNTVATIVLSAGTAGTTYTCTNTITTSTGETWVDTLYIIVPTDVMYNLFRDVRDDLGLTGAGDDGQIFRKLEQAFAAIETYCRRRFIAETETRYFERCDLDDHGFLMHMDRDLLTITTLTNGDSSGTAIPNTEYWLTNAEGRRIPEGPYHAIRLKIDSTYSWEFDTDYMVSVAGTWGYSATPPEDVIRALVRLVSYYYAQKDAQVFDVTAVPEAGVITVPQGIPRDVERILQPYKRQGLA